MSWRLLWQLLLLKCLLGRLLELLGRLLELLRWLLERLVWCLLPVWSRCSLWLAIRAWRTLLLLSWLIAKLRRPLQARDLVGISLRQRPTCWPGYPYPWGGMKAGGPLMLQRDV